MISFPMNPNIKQLLVGLILTLIGSIIFLFYASPDFNLPQYASFLAIGFSVPLLVGIFSMGRGIVLLWRRELNLIRIALILFLLFVGVPVAFYYNFVYGRIVSDGTYTETIFPYGMTSILPSVISLLLLVALFIFVGKNRENAVPKAN